jgi:purine-binding chemotaxis protein CheW
VDAVAVREILPRLELSPVEQMPGYILGVANLRGSIVPIMDLNVRFGRAPDPCRATDCIVVLAQGDTVVGMVVSEVREVRPFNHEQVEWRTSAGQRSADAHFVAGLAKLDEQVVMLLDLERLLRFPESLPEAGEGSAASFALDPRALELAADLEERALLHERALDLARPLARDDFAGLEPVAVTRLGSEFFGFELDGVREFATVHSITPIPCCPRHIVGQVNLRGDIVTLVDLRPALRVAAEPGPTRQMVLLEIAAERFGVSVDEVLEIVALHPSQIGTVPAAQQHGTGEYLKGAVPYRGRMLGILDLPRMVADGSLVVDEEA